MRSARAASPDALPSSRVVRATTSSLFASWRCCALRLRGGVAFDGVRATIAAIAWRCHVLSLVGVVGILSLAGVVAGLRSCLSKGILTLAGVAGLRSCCLSKVAILGSPERSDAEDGAACVAPLCPAAMRLLAPGYRSGLPCKAAIKLLSVYASMCRYASFAEQRQKSL